MDDDTHVKETHQADSLNGTLHLITPLVNVTAVTPLYPDANLLDVYNPSSTSSS